MSARKIGVAALLLVLVTTAAVATPIRIGTKNFTEQFIVGNLMVVYLEEKGFDVELTTGMSSTALREAMESGNLDLCMEYTGTQWFTYTGHKFQGESQEEIYQLARESDAEIGLIWLNPIWCNNTYAIAVTREFAETNDVHDLEALAAYVNNHNGQVHFASDFEFYSRPSYGILELQLRYGFAFRPDYIVTVATGMTSEYLACGDSVAAMVFGTDPIVVKEDWVVLQDTLNFWPPYDLVPVVREETLVENPGLEDALNELVVGFSQDTASARDEMAHWNAQVDVYLQEPRDVAADLLGWIKAKRKCTRSRSWSNLAAAPTHKATVNSYTDELYTWIGTYRTTQFGYNIYNCICPRGVNISQITIDFGTVVAAASQRVPADFAASWVTRARNTIVTYTLKRGKTGIAAGRSAYFAFTLIPQGQP